MTEHLGDDHPARDRSSHGADAGSATGRDRGQAMMLALIGVVVVGLMAVAVGVVGRSMAQRAVAQTAADAGALAGVQGGSEAAARVARQNGATLVSFRQRAGAVGVTVTVVVEVGDQRAIARASSEP